MMHFGLKTYTNKHIILIFIFLCIISKGYSQNNYFKNIHEKRDPFLDTNDSLKKCSLNIFFYNNVLDSIINPIPGVGSIKKDDLKYLEIQAYFKTPNSYQMVDSIEWHELFLAGGFSSDFFQSGTKMGNGAIDEIVEHCKPLPNTLFIYVSKIKLRNGLIIEYPIMKNEKYIIWTDYYKKRVSFDNLSDATNKMKTLDKFDAAEQPMLIFKIK